MHKRYWIIISLGLILLGIVFYLGVLSNDRIKIEELDLEVPLLLDGYAAQEKEALFVREYLLDKPLDKDLFTDKIKKPLAQKGFELLEYAAEPQKDKISHTFKIGRGGRALYILRLKEPKPRLKEPEVSKRPAVIPRRPASKVAIVLDDWGYNMRNIALLDSIDIPLTLSILPSLPYSKRIAVREGQKENREVILHLPMEPGDETIRLEKNTLLTSMDKDKVLLLMEVSLSTVPNAKGASNHMGSKATQDETLVRTVMDELEKRDLYFLDSLATSGTVCEKEAKGRGMRFAKRDVFLDNVADKKYISGQMDKLIGQARRNGSAVGIGHDRRLTLEVIKEKAKQLKDDYEIEFVLTSELTERF